jgi:hypothetical protein
MFAVIGVTGMPMFFESATGFNKTIHKWGGLEHMVNRGKPVAPGRFTGAARQQFGAALLPDVPRWGNFLLKLP